MIFTTLFFLIISSLTILGTTTIFVLTNIQSKQNTLAFIILIVGIVSLFINLFAIYTIQRSKKLGKKTDNFKTISILELFFGAIITGILMLCLKDEHFEKYIDENQYTNDNNNPLEEKLSKLDYYGLILAINYDKSKLKNIINLENKIKISDFEFNNYKCNLISYDLIDGKGVNTFINVKAFEEKNIDDIFSLSDKEIMLLRFHKNFKIYYIYDIYGKKIIRPITHSNYKQYIKSNDEEKLLTQSL